MSMPPRAVGRSVNGWSAEYLDAQYRAYQADPASVPADVRSFLAGFELALAGELRLAGNGSAGGASGGAVNGSAAVLPVVASRRSAPGERVSGEWAVARGSTAGRRPAGRTDSHFQAVVDDIIDAYREHGHLAAQLDPLGTVRERPVTLSLEHHGLDEGDMSRRVDGTSLGLGAEATLRDVVAQLEKMYCGSVGVEFMHIQDEGQRAWLFERFEGARGRLGLTRGEKAHTLELLTKAELFEQFLGKRYPGDKRFSIEGGESLIPLLDRVIEGAAGLGVEEMVVGMAHRGRLNVLNMILGKTYEQIFTEFEESWKEGFLNGGGDVKYHRGYSGTRRLPSGRMVHLSMASNPSHLEAVNGVVQGRCRGKQRLRGDAERRRVIPVLIHGDAALAGQGNIQEVLNFSQLPGYTTGGTIHVVVNNQVGFTTSPEDGRSTRYCTDVGKMIEAPIFHVNGDDPEAVVSAAQFAAEYRQQFRRDVFIDMVCYRKFGHNEQDEASYTQPLMVARIKKQVSVLTKYAKALLDEGVISQADVLAIQGRINEVLDTAQATAKKTPNVPTIDAGSSRWKGYSGSYSFAPVSTGVSEAVLREVAGAMGRVPDGFRVNPKLVKMMEARAALPQTREISYADAESLAYGTLLLEGYGVRISGQDCRRGTFAHRHAVVRDAETGEPYCPLNHMREVGDPGTANEPGTVGSDGRARQGRLCVWDSPLSEFGVMAFEYGYSLSDPRMLVCWEGQFGDFVNGAQTIIDQFVSSAEHKWGRWSGLTLLLPHGYEGAGPEHSSARFERFLELCGQNNMEVVYPSTAAQFFHMFRRQMLRGFRKPLIVMTPKSMLRITTSRLEELTTGSFEEFLDDPAFAGAGGMGGADRRGVKRVVLVSGKLYWELDERRRELGRHDVAIVRVEQFYPFHKAKLAEMLKRYPASAELCYAQEEPLNQGGYRFVDDVLRREMGVAGGARYIGRAASCSPATGAKKQHKYEQEEILTAAIGAKAAGKEKAGEPAKVGAAH